MEKMDLYNRFRAVPQEAQKEIKAGKLKGFTDINPMWRIKMLTEAFGPCGEGWYTQIADRWIDNVGDQFCVQIRINLYVKYGQEWSKPIEGIGGSMLYGKGVGEGAISDEAYKMAYTDALSIACKALGMAADIYYAKDRTKYDAVQPQAVQFDPEPVATPPLEDQNIDNLFPQQQMEDTVVDDLKNRIRACKDLPTMNQIWSDTKKLLMNRPEDFEAIKVAISIRRREAKF